MLKTSVSLSLAVLIAFGASGCSLATVKDNPTNPSITAEASEVKAPNNQHSELEKTTLQTLNEIASIAQSEEYDNLLASLWEIPQESKDLTKHEVVLEENKELVAKINSLIGHSPELLEGAEVLYMDPESDADFSAETLASIENIYGVSRLIEGATYAAMDSSVPESSTFGITAGSVIEDPNGKTKLEEYNLYIQDANNGLIGFIDTFERDLLVEEGGKKIVFAEKVNSEPSSDSVGEKTDSESSSDSVLSQVQNLAVEVETWIIEQGGTEVPLVVENNAIVAGEEGGTPQKYEIERGGTTLEIEGDSWAYVITGTIEGTDGKIIYDSMTGMSQTGEVEAGEVEEYLEPEVHDLDEKEDLSPGLYVPDADEWTQFVNTIVEQQFSTLGEYVEYANSEEYESNATFELVTKDGVEYVKVIDPDSEIVGEVLYATPIL